MVCNAQHFLAFVSNRLAIRSCIIASRSGGRATLRTCTNGQRAPCSFRSPVRDYRVPHRYLTRAQAHSSPSRRLPSLTMAWHHSKTSPPSQSNRSTPKWQARPFLGSGGEVDRARRVFSTRESAQTGQRTESGRRCIRISPTPHCEHTLDCFCDRLPEQRSRKVERSDEHAGSTHWLAERALSRAGQRVTCEAFDCATCVG